MIKEGLAGKHIAITGKLTFYLRREAFELILSCGGMPQEDVTMQTDILVVGHYPPHILRGEKSNKHLLAERYIAEKGKKIQILREDEFLPLLWYCPTADIAV